jgi:hypothetical protein
VADPWKHVFRDNPGFSATASARCNRRGPAFGIALDVAGMERQAGKQLPLDFDPLALKLALDTEQFRAEFVALLVEWGIAVAPEAGSA